MILNDINRIINCLQKTPEVLKSLLVQIDPDLLKKNIITNKWSIHEHACHICVGEKYGYLKRIDQFINDARPQIIPLSGESFPPDFFIKMDLESAIEEFVVLRKKVIDISNSLDDSIWEKQADHPEYKIYTPYIMLRHLLMHDYYHLYKIEELWLTKDEILHRN